MRGQGIKSIEVQYLDENNCRVETHKMTAKTSIPRNMKRKLIAQAKELTKTRTERKWVMTVKCTGGIWFIFHNEGRKK